MDVLLERGHVDEHDVGVLDLGDDLGRRGRLELVGGELDAEAAAFRRFSTQIALDVVRYLIDFAVALTLVAMGLLMRMGKTKTRR